MTYHKIGDNGLYSDGAEVKDKFDMLEVMRAAEDRMHRQMEDIDSSWKMWYYSGCPGTQPTFDCYHRDRCY